MSKQKNQNNMIRVTDEKLINVHNKYLIVATNSRIF